MVSAFLGKHIIRLACFLHIGWAALICVDRRAGDSTPIAVLFNLLPNRFAVVLLLVTVAALAIRFLHRSIKNPASVNVKAFYLLPQQAVLLANAASGIYSTVTQHYADGIVRHWSFICADQLPIMLIATAYTAAVLRIMSYHRVPV
jgi:hypothetical protein